MKPDRESRDLRENRADRQEKLGSPCETLPAKTLADQTGASRQLARTRTSLQSAHRGAKEARHGSGAAGSAGPPVHLALKSGDQAAEPLVTLRLAAPAAAQVMIAGSFSDWKPQRMSRGDSVSAQWQIDLRLKPGRYEYRFLVDGTWIDDPCAASFVPNGFGGRNAVLNVPV